MKPLKIQSHGDKTGKVSYNGNAQCFKCENHLQCRYAEAISHSCPKWRIKSVNRGICYLHNVIRGFTSGFLMLVTPIRHAK
ncbi:hypothetical protein TNCV_2617791 [Trichonephila clavipes]|nr:hypothetical protein TNCV_2617791 [Trichonephila clavipes]